MLVSKSTKMTFPTKCSTSGKNLKKTSNQRSRRKTGCCGLLFYSSILPSFVRGVVGSYELPPDAKKPSTPLPPPKPAQIVDYARQYFQDHGLELCKTLSETDLKQLKQQLIENWGKAKNPSKIIQRKLY